MRYPRIVIPSEARNLCHSQSGTCAPPHVPRTSPLSSAVFHPACALSAPSGHLPLEGKAALRGKPASKSPSGIATIYTPRRFYFFMRRTTIPNSSFLIPHSRKAFIHNQWTEPPKGLTLNPSPNTKSRRSHSGGIFPQFILPPFSRCGVPYTQRVWHRGSQDVRSISSSPRR